MNKSNQYKLRRAQKESYFYIVNDNSTDRDLKGFQQFYNKFVKINKISNIKLRRLEKLRDRGTLVFTKVQNTNGEDLCYQIHIMDNELALSLYTCTAAWIQGRLDLKQQISYANRYLLWENILFIKNRGCEIYDYGGITEQLF